MSRVAAMASAALVLLAACGGGGSGGDASVEARVPDVEGVVSAVDGHRIVIDGTRYVLADDAASVSTYTLDPVPLRTHTFVHAGVDDDTGRVQWVATVGIVSRTDPPRVRYTGRLRSVRDGRATFADGTALLVADDLRLEPGFLAVELDPATDRIVAATAP
jgi:hypothetical protein